MIDPWVKAEAEMKLKGYSFDKIPQYEFIRHIWADGILFWWVSHGCLPTPEQLASAQSWFRNSDQVRPFAANRSLSCVSL